MRFKLSLVLVLFCALFASTPLFAQNRFPQPTEKYVNDYVSILDSSDAATIRGIFDELDDQTGIEATVVTIRRMSDYDADSDAIELFATQWFNAWGIGDKNKNNGALILVAVDDRQLRIEVGSGYDASYNSRLNRIINDEILPAFRENNYSLGITRGAIATALVLGGESFQPSATAQAIRQPVVQTSLSQSSGSDSSQDGWVWGALGTGVLAIGGIGVRTYLRLRPRTCQQCNLRMVRLYEDQDDAYLEDGQRKEEAIGSVNYDVWKCPGCGKHEMHRYANFFTVYKACPQCGYQSIHTETSILERPTMHYTGRKIIEQACRHCLFTHKEIIVLPRIRIKSGSSSSQRTFGGGRSSGGGASGRW